MSPLARFAEYAREFEQTYVDDDWSRLGRHFAPDAVYEVRNTSFACRLQGRDAIFAGIKKSLDGFDRRFAGREPALTGPPAEDGDTVSVSWAVTYTKPGAPPFVLRGRSSARCRDGVIVELVDEYPDGMDEEATRWVRAHAPEVDPSYV